MPLPDRPRRLRRDGIRDLVRETALRPSDLIAPVFVDANATEPIPIDSLPGQYRLPISGVADHVDDLRSRGIESILLFGIPGSKDDTGTRAWADDGVVQRALGELPRSSSLTVMTDVCLCEYTDHGHCGPLESDLDRSDPTSATLTVDNDATLELLEKTAVSHAEAGADVVAPSGMMDGMVGRIRHGLDDAGWTSVAIMSYAAKYHSAFYGPFRDAADGAPSFGDRRHYQMDSANAQEALKEVRYDVEEGADIVMVKPAMAYLDVVHSVSQAVDLPVTAYNVSGEYAMIHAAADRGWVDLEEAAMETVLSIKRAGADAIITYFAADLAPRL